jgi:hypothetical protein
MVTPGNGGSHWIERSLPIVVCQLYQLLPQIIINRNNKNHNNRGDIMLELKGQAMVFVTMDTPLNYTY